VALELLCAVALKKYKLSEKRLVCLGTIMNTKKENDSRVATGAVATPGAEQTPCHMSRRHATIHADLVKEMRMNEEQSAKLASWLSVDFRRHRQKNLATAYHEEYFGFWGFTRSDYIRNLIMDVIEVIFRPRILYTSNTNDTQFESICIISSITTGALKVACDRNSMPSLPPTNEEALLCVLELFNMSAGVIRFDNMLNAPMISSIDRLEQSRRSSYGNLKHHSNSDFYQLFKCKRSHRDENASAKILTGYDLSTDSICRLSRIIKAHELKIHNLEAQLSYTLKSMEANEAELRCLQAREGETRRNDAARFNTARLIVALKNIGDIPEATAAKLLQALRLRTVPVNELVKMRFGDGSQGACGAQEILVQEAPPQVQILQRPAQEGGTRRTLDCEAQTTSDAVGHEVAT